MGRVGSCIAAYEVINRHGDKTFVHLLVVSVVKTLMFFERSPARDCEMPIAPKKVFISMPGLHVALQIPKKKTLARHTSSQHVVESVWYTKIAVGGAY